MRPIFAVVLLIQAPAVAIQEAPAPLCSRCFTRTVQGANFCHNCGLPLRSEKGVYRNPKLGVRLKVDPREAQIRTEDFKHGWSGTQCEIEGTDGDFSGVITFYVWGADGTAFADWREGSWKTTAGVTAVRSVSRKELRRDYGHWVLGEYVVTYQDAEWHYLEVFIGRGSRNIELALWTRETLWEEQRDAMLHVTEGLTFERVRSCPGCLGDVAADLKQCGCGAPILPANAKLAEMCRKFDIQIVADSAKHYPVKTLSGNTLTGKPASKKNVDRFCDILAEELAKYPEDLLRKITLERIVLSRSLKRDGTVYGGFAEYDSDTIHFDVNEGWDIEGFMRAKVHHELFHFIDYRDDLTIDKDETWEKLNGEDFKYDPKKSGFGGIDETQNGFLNTYSQTGVGEDKAEIFGYLVGHPGAIAKRARSDEVISRKVARMKELARSYCGALDDSFWDSLRD